MLRSTLDGLGVVVKYWHRERTCFEKREEDQQMSGVMKLYETGTVEAKMRCSG